MASMGRKPSTPGGRETEGQRPARCGITHSENWMPMRTTTTVIVHWVTRRKVRTFFTAVDCRRARRKAMTGVKGSVTERSHFGFRISDLPGVRLREFRTCHGVAPWAKPDFKCYRSSIGLRGVVDEAPILFIW